MANDRYGPWALIAGGSDGIGAAFAREAAKRRLNLILIARRIEPLEETAREIRAAHPGIEVRTLSQDLSADDAVDRITGFAADVEIGTLIYNAGSETTYEDYLDLDWDFLHARLMRNFVVKSALVHQFGRLMRQRQRGGIILMGSVAGFCGSPGFAFYAASKAFTHTLAEGLWYEFKKENVDLLCPIVGLTNTPTMINSHGPIEGHATDPAFIARGGFDRLADGPIWIADDIVESVKAIASLPPAERAVVGAQAGAAFAKKPLR